MYQTSAKYVKKRVIGWQIDRVWPIMTKKWTPDHFAFFSHPLKYKHHHLRFCYILEISKIIAVGCVLKMTEIQRKRFQPHLCCSYAIRMRLQVHNKMEIYCVLKLYKFTKACSVEVFFQFFFVFGVIVITTIKRMQQQTDKSVRWKQSAPIGALSLFERIHRRERQRKG